MAVYKIKLTMEDYPDVERVIEVIDNQSFETLHKGILDSIGFDDSQLASFYLCDDNWNEKLEITLLDMSDEETESFTPTMAHVKLKEYIHHIGDKFKYVSDFVLMWNFQGEVIDIQQEVDSKATYPKVVSSTGIAPPQYAEEKFPEALSEEEDVLLVDLLLKNHDILNPDDDLDEEDEEEDPWDAGFGEFDNGKEEW